MAGKLEWQTHWHQLVTGEPVSGQLLFAQIGNIQEPSVGTEGNSFGQGPDLGLAQLAHLLAVGLEEHRTRMVVTEKGVFWHGAAAAIGRDRPAIGAGRPPPQTFPPPPPPPFSAS